MLQNWFCSGSELVGKTFEREHVWFGFAKESQLATHIPHEYDNLTRGTCTPKIFFKVQGNNFKV